MKKTKTKKSEKTQLSIHYFDVEHERWSIVFPRRRLCKDNRFNLIIITKKNLRFTDLSPKP